MFRVDRRAAARSCRGNRLAVVVVNEVTACKNAVNISARGRLINYDIAFFVGGNLAAEELRAGVMTDGDEHCGEILRGGFTSHRVFKLETANFAIYLDDLFHCFIKLPLNLWVRARTFQHDLGGAEFFAAVNDGDGFCELG